MMTPFIDYRPAEVRTGKIIRVVYYALNPETNKLQQKTVKCNRMHTRAANVKYAKMVALKINAKLLEGWNPFIESISQNVYTKLADAVKHFLDVKCKDLRKDSIRSYVSQAKMLTDYLERHNQSKILCLSFDSRHAHQFMSEIAGKVSARTYNNYLVFFKTLWNFFIENEYVKDDPFLKIHKKHEDEKVRTTILPEDRLKIEKYFAEVSPEFLIICKMCYNCLIRPKEALQLRIGNINVKDKLLIIPADVAKNHHERHIAMPDSIMEYLTTVATLPPKYYIFSTGYKPGTKLLTTRETGKTWSTMRNKLNMPKEYQFYSLKDTGITDMLEKGVPPKYVKELADHSSLEMTEKYLHKSTAHEILKHTQMTW